MQIHQILANASPGDAISGSAFRIRELLREIGRSEIYARGFSHDLIGDVFPLHEFDKGRSGPPGNDILLYHMSIGELDVFRFLHERPERVVLVYHNIAPADRYWPYDPAFAGLLEAGRLELAYMRDRVEFAIADSTFNAEELHSLGYRNVHVSPLIVQLGGNPRSRAERETVETIRNLDGPLVLYVGQLLPHKRPELLMMAYHYLITYLDPSVHLAMVGHSRLEGYARAIKTFGKELNLRQLWMPGMVTDDQLAAFYTEAQLFVTASDHEGFCVPLLECMAAGLPIVARGSGAIPETLGGAGVVLPEDAGPQLIAEAMFEVLQNHALRRDLVELEARRLPEFAPEKTEAQFLSRLMAAV